MRCAGVVVLCLLCRCAAAVDHPEIRVVLEQQVQAWNRGDLEGFMAHYWRSDDLVFKSPKGETHGWQLGTYAEGVIQQSPGSAAQPRHPG